METLPPKDRLRSFDILANVEAMRFDIDMYGYVLDETREQVGNEQLTYLTEGLDRAARTSFILKRQGGELAYFDGGTWRPYSYMLQAGLEANSHDAVVDPRRQFLVEWAQNDYYHYSQFRKLSPGQQYVWASPYPHHIEARFDAKFMSECGLRSDRKMGFIYRANCLEDGSVLLETQTVDRSDDEALAEVVETAASDPEISLDALVFIYDNALMRKNPGQKFFAGRLNAERDEDAWQQVWQNQDLVKYLLDGLEGLAFKQAQGHDVEEATKRHIYGVWALFKKRMDGKLENAGLSQKPMVEQVINAFHEYASTGHVLVGCGGEIKIINGEDDVLNSSTDDIFSSIFGTKPETCEFTSKKCPVCKEENAKTKVEDGKYVHVGKGCTS